MGKRHVGILTGLGRGGVPEVAGSGGVRHLEVPTEHSMGKKRP